MSAEEKLQETIKKHNGQHSQVYWFQFNKSETKTFVDMMEEYAEQQIQKNKESTDLRDRFAGKALQGILSSNPARSERDTPIYWAETAYQFADAMLIEREKPCQTQP